MAITPNNYGSTSATGGTAGVTGKPDLANDANALMDEAKSAAGKVVHEAKEQVGSLADRAKTELSHATDRAKSMAADQKDMIADQVDGVVSAIGRAATDLEESNGPTAQYARMIADNAEKLSSTIRDKDVDQLLGMAQEFGRKQPVVFMGAAALLGFAASRFVLASAKRREDATPSAASAGGYNTNTATGGYSTNNATGGYGTNNAVGGSTSDYASEPATNFGTNPSTNNTNNGGF